MTPENDADTRRLPAAAGDTEPRIFTSAELLGDDDEITVLHNGATYRLRVTRQNKLILTK